MIFCSQVSLSRQKIMFTEGVIHTESRNNYALKILYVILPHYVPSPQKQCQWKVRGISPLSLSFPVALCAGMDDR